ncbi:MAG TPA: YciI family protein [Vicinamibacterales bacterium]|nr:YciI family protein [Vicinamibacterales bacterium]
MPKYMLLLHDDPSSFATISPEQMQQVIQKYVAWGNRLKKAGIIQGGEKLTDEPGRIVKRRDGQIRVTDGPYSETKEVLGGYYIIEAATYEQAVQHSQDCPHLEYGGTIEVRQVDMM